jgi:hypothetical protein
VDDQNNKHKACLILKRYYQVSSIDYIQTFSSMIKLNSIRSFRALVVKFDCEVRQMDVKTTFVNGDMKKRYDI